MPLIQVGVFNLRHHLVEGVGFSLATFGWCHQVDVGETLATRLGVPCGSPCCGLPRQKNGYPRENPGCTGVH